MQPYKIVGLGFVIGILSGMLGIGGGVFMVPAMVSLMGIAQHTAHGTSLAVVIPTAVLSGLVYGFKGNIDLGLAALLVIGSITGAYFGSRLMTHLRPVVLQRLFGALAIFVAIRMVIG